MSEIALGCMNNMGIFPKFLQSQTSLYDEDSCEVGKSVEVSFHEEKALVTVNRQYLEMSEDMGGTISPRYTKDAQAGHTS